MGIRFDEFAL